MKRESFEKAADTQDDEYMMIVSSLGYPAAEKAEVDKNLREMVHGDERLEPAELFYKKDFAHPLMNDIHEDALEADIIRIGYYKKMLDEVLKSVRARLFAMRIRSRAAYD